MLRMDDDDEPVTEEDFQRLREAKAALNQPERWSTMEEVLADFGLTLDRPLAMPVFDSIQHFSQTGSGV
jgi:hypothetical protein